MKKLKILHSVTVSNLLLSLPSTQNQNISLISAFVQKIINAYFNLQKDIKIYKPVGIKGFRNYV